MDALGVRSIRLSAVAEWLVAASFLLGTFVVAALIVRELQPPPAAQAAAPVAPLPGSIPAAVPSGAVSVPVLPLPDGIELRIGETMSGIAARLGRSAESGRQEVDGGALGERLTRFYEYRGTRFILVFEPFERGGEAKLGAIYLR
jgi:hypothetical protein